MPQKYIGEIHYKPTHEILKYTDAEKFINDFRNMLDHTGIMEFRRGYITKTTLTFAIKYMPLLKASLAIANQNHNILLKKQRRNLTWQRN